MKRINNHQSPNNIKKDDAVYIQDRGFNSFEDNIIKLPVDKTKWTDLLARNGAFKLDFDLNI